MIRHIVFFNFNDGVNIEEKNAFAGLLSGLKEKVPLVRELNVAFDIGRKPNSYELCLDSVFDSMEAVDKYAVHPDHMKVLDEVKRICSSTAKVDYEMD